MNYTLFDTKKPLTVLPAEHSMGDSLFAYTEIKMHHLIRNGNYDKINIIPSYNRNAEVSLFEKNDKLFNYKRPTATLKPNGILELYVYPGYFYTYHYASLIQTYLQLTGRPVKIELSYPTTRCAELELKRSNLPAIPPADFLIFGIVDNLQGIVSGRWQDGDGDFIWKSGILSGKSVTLVGCKHSVWADVAGSLVKVLAELGFMNIVYVGKLGTLKDNVAPNQMLASGCSTFIHGQEISWESFLEIPKDICYWGKHITLPSVLQETKYWNQQHVGHYDFVDPEIGFMAWEAMQSGVNFNYLHVISDNTTTKFEEDLSNERLNSVRTKRQQLYQLISEILMHSITNYGIRKTA